MTQDEYNNLSPEEQNALTEVHVLGGRIEERENVCRFLYSAKGNQLGMQEWFSGEWVYDIDPDYFKSLDRAFMGVDRLRKANLGNGLYWKATNNIYDGRFRMSIGVEVRGVIARAYGKTLNEAIMLATLKAKGVVE